MQFAKEELLSLLEEQGIFIDDLDSNEVIVFDSLIFVTFVISIENHFSIEIPDKYMTYEEFNTINKIIQSRNTTNASFPI